MLEARLRFATKPLDSTMTENSKIVAKIREAYQHRDTRYNRRYHAKRCLAYRLSWPVPASTYLVSYQTSRPEGVFS